MFIDKGIDVFLQLFADFIGGFVVHQQIHHHVVRHEVTGDRVQRDPQHLVLRKAEGAGGDQRERYTFASAFIRRPKSVPIAGGKLFSFVERSVLPDGPKGMDDVFAGKPEAGSHGGFAFFQQGQRVAGCSQLRACRKVDAGVRTAAAGIQIVGGVYDGVHLHLGDVLAYDLVWHDFSPSL